MNNLSKILLGFMLVVMICCVSAVSATDINSTDDTLITDDIAVDDVSEIVEDVEIDEVEDDLVEEQEANPVDGTINGQTWDNYVYNTTGYLKTNDNLTFSGDFYAQSFGNFKVDKNIRINAAGATFHNIGFDLMVSQITLNGGTFIFDENAAVNSVIYDLGSENTIQNTIINITAPANVDFYAINLNQPNGAQILNNNITYRANYANPTNYNYVVKVLRGSNVKMIGNNITAYLPLKDVDYTNYTTRFPTIDLDFVAGVAVESSGKFLFENNTLNVTGSLRGGYYPTLDAFIIVKSDNAKVIGNKIYLRDNASAQNDTNYLYAVDIYRCEKILVDANEIRINTDGGKVTTNGTGAAYGIQLTGWHVDVVISNNNITTANNGPNLGIYSQNAQASTALTITGNNINVTGRAGTNNYALVSGMELQDTNDYISGNTIVVNNIGNYVANQTYAFGISYCQETIGPHWFFMEDNDVTVYNGDYAVYLIGWSRGSVTDNTLIAYGNTTQTGDNAVEAPDEVTVENNN